MAIVDIKDFINLVEKSCKDEVLQVKNGTKVHTLKPLKSFYSYDELHDELLDIWLETLEDENHYYFWLECCEEARAKLEKEGISEDSDNYDEDLFYVYAEEIRENSAEELAEAEYSRAANLLFYNLQDDPDLRSLSELKKVFRKPKSENCIFQLYDLNYYFEQTASLKEADKVDCCFYEDTVPLADEEKKEILRNDSTWKTARQRLSEDHRKIEDNAPAERKNNWVFDDESEDFYEAEKPFYYYSSVDTIIIEDEEYENLKSLYIKKFGGWETIDLESTEYNGKKWY